MTLELAGRPLLFLDTPGHAMHHHCIWDERSRGFFTGDTFGLSYREFDTARGAWIMPTTTPVQFQPEALRRSIERMLAFAPQRMLLTHYGRGRATCRASPRCLLAQLDEMVALARSLRRRRRTAMPALKRGLEAIHLKSLRAHGVTLSRRAHPRAARASTSSSMPRASASGSTAPEPDHEPRIRFDFTGQVVVVTGAANGIGAACARLFAASGAAVALWDVDAAAAQALAAELGADARARDPLQRRRAAARSRPRSRRRSPRSAASTS